MSALAHSTQTYLHFGEFDFAEAISDAGSVDELKRVGERICRVFGLRYFLILRSADGKQSFSDLVLLSNWPEGLMAEYDARDLQRGSPVFFKTKSSTEPTVFDINTFNKQRSDGLGSFTTDLFAQFGANAGVNFNVQLPDGRSGIVSFLTGDGQPSSTVIAELDHLATELFSRISELKDAVGANRYGLNRHEIDCLGWISEGKLRTEIAEILGLSETTVNLYLASAIRKMAARHVGHAVSLALRGGIIS